LVACFKAGGLNKKNGAWHGVLGGKPISGITTADLAREGMLTVTTKHRNGSARLTERGNWFARTLFEQFPAGMVEGGEREQPADEVRIAPPDQVRVAHRRRS
jgi:hypothetical protein